MTIIPNYQTSEKRISSKVDRFFKELQVGKLLKQSNFYKECGFTCLFVFKMIFLLIFGNKNLYQTLQREDSSDRPGKDTVYRFLNSSRYNWRKQKSSLYEIAIARKVGWLCCQRISKNLMKKLYESMANGGILKCFLK